MVNTSISGNVVLSPAQVQALFVQPVIDGAVATRVASVITTSSPETRFPIVSADPTASWVDEGQEITVSDAQFDEVEVNPRKLAGLSIITRELANDSSPAALDIIGQGLTRDTIRKLDAAFFGTVPNPAPAGLGRTTGFTEIEVPDYDPVNDWDGGYTFGHFVDARVEAEARGANITSWVMNPRTAARIYKRFAVPYQPTSVNGVETNGYLQGVTEVLGVPIVTTPACPEKIAYGIPRDRVFVVVREDVEVETDRSVFFTSDRIAVRSVMRAGFGFIDPASIVALKLTA